MTYSISITIYALLATATTFASLPQTVKACLLQAVASLYIYVLDSLFGYCQPASLNLNTIQPEDMTADRLHSDRVYTVYFNGYSVTQWFTGIRIANLLALGWTVSYEVFSQQATTEQATATATADSLFDATATVDSLLYELTTGWHTEQTASQPACYAQPATVTPWYTEQAEVDLLKFWLSPEQQETAIPQVRQHYRIHEQATATTATATAKRKKYQKTAGRFKAVATDSNIYCVIDTATDTTVKAGCTWKQAHDKAYWLNRKQRQQTACLLAEV